MPNLNKQITHHEAHCEGPEVKRLYIRDYDKNSKQRFIPWGLICQNCGVLVPQPYIHNLTKKQKEMNGNRNKSRLQSLGDLKSGYEKDPKGWEERELYHVKFTKALKTTQTVKRKIDQDPSYDPPISKYEKTLRNRIRSLGKIYRDDCKRYPVLKKHIKWDEKLVERFLEIRPEGWEIVEVLEWPPLHRRTVREANRERGYYNDPEHPGYRNYDRTTINGSSEYNPDKLSGFSKAVIAEATGRMTFMETTIQKHKIAVIETSK